MMGTSNYADANTSCLYVIEDTEFLDDAIEGIQGDLEALERNEDCDFLYYGTDMELDHHRNYPSKSIGVITTTIEDSLLNADDPLNVSLTIKSVLGYYSGATLDYDLGLEYVDYTCDNVGDLLGQLTEFPDDYLADALEVAYAPCDKHDLEALTKAQKEFMDSLDLEPLKTKIEAEVTKLATSLEKIFDTWSHLKLGVDARYSNGEAHYSKI